MITVFLAQKPVLISEQLNRKNKQIRDCQDARAGSRAQVFASVYGLNETQGR